ncbi:SRPBCC domain-containing protein [Georgenia subflava]|uniref:ATPase n=1 Tax=Georgenia subflava TaxID=1622177 RepID=A0A6N7EN11_9MICO|nr:SRPBCC domain-containing protein [Georgenia subflava]MPV36604.1 ATPase [Georgenia subflava]
MNTDDSLRELSFTVSGRVSRPCAEVYEAVADPRQLSQYFTTGGARGRLEPGADVSWDFHDFPGAFPVTVVAADPPRRIVIEWEGEASSGTRGVTTTTFEFEPIDGDTRTLVTISESSWLPTADGARNAFGNCEGWTGMLAALKAWVEHGINLREGFYK